MFDQESKNKFIIIILIIFNLIICSVCTKQNTEWRGKIEEENGITIVRNPKKPLYTGSHFYLEEDLSLGETKGKEEYMFSRIKIEVDEEENIYVLDMKASNIRVFDKHKEFLRTIGGKGQGPGEMQMPVIFQVTPKREVMVYDVVSRRLTFFSQDGKYLKQISAANIRALVLSLKADLSGNFIGLLSYNPWTKEIKKYNSKLEPSFTIAKKEEKPNQGDVRRMMTPSLKYEISKDGYIIWGYSNKYELNVVNPEGKLIRKINKIYDPVKLSEKSKNKRKEKMIRRMASFGLKAKLLFPKYHPPFLDFSLDEKGNIFVLTIGKDEKKYFDLFNVEGRYIAKVPLKITLSEIILKKDKLYTIDENEEGFPVVKRYRIIWH